mmetsp:Transcript_60632/g.120125  ORF Transcript_60632/g.120125 Transcript_60632/m.120125 type:complete len:116 (+) Transcript_60632:145-492(+)
MHPRKRSAAHSSQQHPSEAIFGRPDPFKPHYTKTWHMEGNSTSKCGQEGANSMVTQAVKASVMIVTTGKSKAKKPKKGGRQSTTGQDRDRKLRCICKLQATRERECNPTKLADNG